MVRGAGIGDALVEGATLLLVGLVAKEIGFQLEGHGPCAPDALLHADAQQVFGTQATFSDKGVTEIRVDHLSTPDGDSPGMGVPVGNRRQFRWTCHALAIFGRLWLRNLRAHPFRRGGELQIPEGAVIPLRTQSF